MRSSRGIRRRDAAGRRGRKYLAFLRRHCIQVAVAQILVVRPPIIMRIGLTHLLPILGLVLLTGCEKRTHVSADYEFVQPRTYLIESGSPERSLYYKGKRVWWNVLMGSDETCHNGILVFMSTVPRGEGGSNVSPQIFAIRGAGPPVVLSGRILNQPFKAESSHVAGSIYELESLAPIANGVRVVFMIGVADNGSDITVTHDLLWTEIEGWVQEAETSASLQIAPLGNYRVLPMQRPNTALEPTPTSH